MLRTILIYGAVLAAGTFVLQWLEFRLLVRTHAAEAYVALVAAAFLGLGVWLGAKVLRRAPAAPFAPNVRAQETLRISGRELEVLELLAAGRSNKEIARQLAVSPNTVKTHVTKLFDKLQVRRRTEAIQKARELGMTMPILGGDGWVGDALKNGREALKNTFISNHYSGENPDPVVQNFRKAYRAKFNREPDSIAALGYFYLQENDLDSAIEECRAAVQCDPSYDPAHVELAVALSRAGRFDDAVRSAFIRLAERFHAEAALGIDAVWVIDLGGHGASTVVVRCGRCFVSPGSPPDEPDVTLRPVILLHPARGMGRLLAVARPVAMEAARDIDRIVDVGIDRGAVEGRLEMRRQDRHREKSAQVDQPVCLPRGSPPARRGRNVAADHAPGRHGDSAHEAHLDPRAVGGEVGVVRRGREGAEVVLFQPGHGVRRPRSLRGRERTRTRNERVELAILPERRCAVLAVPSARQPDRVLRVVDREDRAVTRRVVCGSPLDREHGYLCRPAIGRAVHRDGDPAIVSAFLAVVAKVRCATSSTRPEHLQLGLPLVVVEDLVRRDCRSTGRPASRRRAPPTASSSGWRARSGSTRSSPASPR